MGGGVHRNGDLGAASAHHHFQGFPMKIRIYTESRTFPRLLGSIYPPRRPQFGFFLTCPNRAHPSKGSHIESPRSIIASADWLLRDAPGPRRSHTEHNDTGDDGFAQILIRFSSAGCECLFMSVSPEQKNRIHNHFRNLIRIGTMPTPATSLIMSPVK